MLLLDVNLAFSPIINSKVLIETVSLRDIVSGNRVRFVNISRVNVFVIAANACL